MFSLSLRNADHFRHYSVHRVQGAGWEVKHEEDRALVQRAIYQDWHRVERACAVFALQVSELTAQGWQVVADESRLSSQMPLAAVARMLPTR
jgi:hypothetical protein